MFDVGLSVGQSPAHAYLARQRWLRLGVLTGTEDDHILLWICVEGLGCQTA